MAQEVIKSFGYKDDSRKVSLFIKQNYPMVHLKFNKENEELIIISKDLKKLKAVFNILYIINRFNLI